MWISSAVNTPSICVESSQDIDMLEEYDTFAADSDAHAKGTDRRGLLHSS